MDETMNAIGEQLSTRHLLDKFLDLFRTEEGKSEIRRVARQAGRKTIEKIKEHPIPSAMVGAAIGYLIFMEDREEELAEKLGKRFRRAIGREKADVSSFLDEEEACRMAGETSSVVTYVSGSEAVTDMDTEEISGEGMAARAKGKLAGAAGAVKDAAGSAKDRVSDAAGVIKDKTSTVAAKVKESASSAAHGIRNAASSAVSSAAHKVGDAACSASAKMSDLAGMAGEKARQFGTHVRSGVVEAGHIVRARADNIGHQVRQGYNYGRERAVEMSDEHPLAVGAALLGLGVLVGLSLPRTRPEDEFIGDRADQLKRRAKTKGREAINRGMHVAQVTAEQTIDEAKRQGLTPSSIIDKARHVAAELKDAAGGIAQREELTPDQLGDKVKAVADRAKETARQEIGQSANLQESTR